MDRRHPGPPRESCLITLRTGMSKAAPTAPPRPQPLHEKAGWVCKARGIWQPVVERSCQSLSFGKPGSPVTMLVGAVADAPRSKVNKKRVLNKSGINAEIADTLADRSRLTEVAYFPARPTCIDVTDHFLEIWIVDLRDGVPHD